ncbi:MAG: hypothetical protein A3J93_04345 [Candidatus Magasanikbacteria bacterium RIFOXYC2_FULL_42_28]|uniref:Undecaprenyl-phosphate alpha-N-acetylglucosaminyl 1-phosphate transferase n=1 Tax=Candidatus Magasanikbacteria bacterium RIFOXYC2_FULL_42_28 TaxID=1798704 RepID=A0A1F6NX22_9BACT|nr:MAG: hypothetical protein A3J93_04345 [Candidatus Magasanikbacteria bacterium RIFOXYC2_FULL_42_28]
MYFFLVSLALSALFTFGAIKLFTTIKLFDIPDGGRKLHSRPVPLGGGIAIFLAFWLVVGYIINFTNLFGKNLHPVDLVGVFFGSLVLLIVGLFDDKQRLSPVARLTAIALACFLAIGGGVGIDKITNPLGGVIGLSGLGASALVFVWIFGMTSTVKILDGLDGLAAGITAIGALVIYGVASGERWHQPDMALLALIFVGAILGFLIFNFQPAKIFLGEGGGMFLGYILGILAVISGGKIATALLVMAVPILDLIRVIIVRVRRHQSIFQGDREHIYYWLADKFKISERTIVLMLYVVAAGFGSLAWFLQSVGKLVALLFAIALMGVVALAIGRGDNNVKFPISNVKSNPKS